MSTIESFFIFMTLNYIDVAYRSPWFSIKIKLKNHDYNKIDILKKPLIKALDINFFY